MGKVESNPNSLFGNHVDLDNKRTDSLVTLVSCRGVTNDFDGNSIATQSRAAKYAVAVKNVEYSHSGSKQKILNGLNMTVSQGSIYGLTGSSGCGKTTLISCIIGTRQVNAGDIFLYGCNINDSDRLKFVKIPGRDIGYMPQDLSLYSKFTIHEILVYFGRIYGMSSYDINEACINILALLQLTKVSTPIESMSGGEKRRISFAVSLIHSPKLLVLDEPTVGMDPLLRFRIWDHMKYLVKEQQVTVIITSHYLDEMRKADKIGIMRNGQLIAENSPQALLSICRASSLDEVVLKICKDGHLAATPNFMMTEDDKLQIAYKDHGENQVSRAQNLKSKVDRIRTLMGKNVYLLLRNVPLFLFVMCIPALELLTVLVMGYEPSHIPLGIVNKELAFSGNENNWNYASGRQSCPEISEGSFQTCDLNLLSCHFLSHLSKTRVSLHHFEGEADATLAVDQGNIFGYLSFSNTFSNSLADRFFSPMENGTLDIVAFDGAQIVARFDQTNAIVYRLLLVELYKSQEKFLRSILSACGIPKQVGEYPLQFNSPVYGDEDHFGFSSYVGPSASIPFMFFFSIISSGIRFIDERNCGMLERMLICGVQISEVLMAYMISEFMLIIVQAGMVFLLLSWWVPIHSVNWVADIFAFLLQILAGYTGVSLGFLLGTLCSEQIQVAIFAVTFILPNILLSGVIWPLEAMPQVMKTIVKFLPCTLPAESIRSIWSRGLGFTHPNVWPGSISLLGYIAILVLVTLMYKQKLK